MRDKIILITGVAGFIGGNVAKRLLDNGNKVIGIDNLNSYYDIELKNERLRLINASLNKKDFKFCKCNIENYQLLINIFDEFKPEIVINLAALAGVRSSIDNPREYISTNIVGFSNVLEGCRNFNVKNLIYASSSSIYGGSKNFPSKESSISDHPVSLYAATKKSNEVLAHSYSQLYGIPSIGLRFFTVYGPLGRPDMAPMIFANSIIKRKPIKIFNNGDMMRDFTYIDDVIDAILGCCIKPAQVDYNFDFINPNPARSFAPHMIFNVGNGKSVPLLKFIDLLEKELKIEAIREFLPMQLGDVKETYSDNSYINAWTGFEPKTSIEEGIKKFIKWFKEYY